MMLNLGFRLNHKYTIMKRKIKLISYIIAISGVVIDVFITIYSFFNIVNSYYPLVWGTRVIVIINLIIIDCLQEKKRMLTLIPVLTVMILAFIVSLVT